MRRKEENSVLRKIFVGLLLFIALSCKNNDSAPPTDLSVTNTPLTNITISKATASGTILTDGNAAITQSAIVWSKTNATPTLTISVIASTTSKRSFTINLTGLDFNTAYYIRAFATNSVGTGYRDVVKLNTTNDTQKHALPITRRKWFMALLLVLQLILKWLDHNLRATKVATSYDDYKAYGDLFQWERPADGHQLISRTFSTTGVAVNGMTNV